MIVHSGLPRRTGEDIVFASGEGGTAIDVSGRRYTDFILGYGPIVLGHAVPEFVSLINQYARHGLLLPGYATFHYDLLQRLLGGDLAARYSAAFFKTGSESVSAAIRIAARATGRQAIIRCGFLGWHDALIGSTVRWHEPLSSPFRHLVRLTEGIRGVSGEERALNWVSLQLPELQSIVAAHGGAVSCFLIDMYQLRFVSPDVVAAAMRLCREHGILVVADETKISGRAASLGFSVDLELDADMIVAGKALANGAPLSLLIGRPDLMAFAEPARVTGTFSQELSAVYAALATLELMHRDDGFETIRSVTNDVVTLFNAAAESARIDEVVRAESLFGGAMFEVVFAQDYLGNRQLRRQLCAELAAEGILLLEGHPSYACVAHALVDQSALHNGFARALSAWAAQCR